MKLFIQFLLLFGFLVLTLIPSSVLGAHYKPSRAVNYNTNKAVFSPPDVVFAVIWPVLYTLMSVSMWLILRKADNTTHTVMSKEYVVPLICVFVAQLALNFSWIPVFSIGKFKTSLWILLSTLLLAIITMILMSTMNTLSTVLWTPYVVWLFFAVHLNIAFIVNRTNNKT